MFAKRESIRLKTISTVNRLHAPLDSLDACRNTHKTFQSLCVLDLLSEAGKTAHFVVVQRILAQACAVLRNSQAKTPNATNKQPQNKRFEPESFQIDC